MLMLCMLIEKIYFNQLLDDISRISLPLVFLQAYVWKGELNAGTYYLLPFTSGCRLKKRSKKSLPTKPVELVSRADTGELDLTRDLRFVCVCM